MPARRALVLALREAGYATFADLIERDALLPQEAIYAFERFSCAPGRGLTLGTIVAVEGTIRHHLNPELEWDADVERGAVMAALTVPLAIELRWRPQSADVDWGRRFRTVTNKARRLVAKVLA